jgi:hypothetical protein
LDETKHFIGCHSQLKDSSRNVLYTVDSNVVRVRSEIDGVAKDLSAINLQVTKLNTCLGVAQPTMHGTTSARTATMKLPIAIPLMAPDESSESCRLDSGGKGVVVGAAVGADVETVTETHSC